MLDVVFKLAEIGLKDFLGPTLGWILLFVIVTFSIGFFSFRSFKSTLTTKKISKGWIIAIGIFHLLLLPALFGHLGFLFSVQRFTGKMLEKSSIPMTNWTLTLGEKAAKGYLGEVEQETVLDLEEIHQKIKEQIKNSKKIPATKNPITLLFNLPDVLQGIFLKGLDSAMVPIKSKMQKVTWGTLLDKTKVYLSKEGQQLFQNQANKFYRSALLYVFLGFVGILILHFATRFLIKKLIQSKMKAS